MSGLLFNLEDRTDDTTGAYGTFHLLNNAVTGPAGADGEGAPNSATYVTLSTNGTLTGERVLTAGTGITLTDGGAGSTVTVATSAVLPTLADAKGDLLVASAADTITRLPVGTDNYVLTADSAEATGIKWAAAGSGASLPAQPKSDLTNSSIRFSGVPGVHILSAGSGVLIGATAKVYTPMIVTGASITITAAELRVTGASSAGTRVRVSLYEATQLWQPDALVADWGAVTTDSTGRKTITGLSTVCAAGYYLVCIHAEANVTIEAHTASTPWFSEHPLTLNHPAAGFTGSGTYGAAVDPGSAATGILAYSSTGLYEFVTFIWT